MERDGVERSTEEGKKPKYNKAHDFEGEINEECFEFIDLSWCHLGQLPRGPLPRSKRRMRLLKGLSDKQKLDSFCRPPGSYTQDEID